MYRKFKPLKIPDGWEQYWSKYPNGYTIMEALIDWVSQVDDMVKNQNELNVTVNSFGDRIDEFINQFGAELQEEVKNLLTEWQDSGFLEVVIGQALQTQIDEVESRNPRVNIVTYGAVAMKDDPLFDNADIINTVAATLNKGQTLYIPEGNFLISNTVNIPSGLNVEMESILFYNGTHDRPAVVYGDATVSSVNKLRFNIESLEQSTWADDRYIGLVLKNIQRTTDVIVYRSNKFTTGVKLIGEGAGFAYTSIVFNQLLGNKTAVIATNASSGWFNENALTFKSIMQYSGVNPGVSRYGFILTSDDGSYKNNNNNVINGSFELKINEARKNNSLGEAIPITIEHGTENTVQNARDEDNSPVFVRVLNSSSYNSIRLGYGSGRMEDLSTGGYNKLTTNRNVLQDTPHVIFDSGNISQNATKYNSDTQLQFTNLHTEASTLGVPRQSYLNFTLTPDYVEFPSTRGVGRFVNTSLAKSFLVRADTNDGHRGRVAVRCYDAAGNVVNGGNTLRSKLSNTMIYTGDFGGVYRRGADDSLNVYFTVGENVAYVDVMVIGGTTTCQLKSLKIISLDNFEANNWTIFNQQSARSTNTISSVPDYIGQIAVVGGIGYIATNTLDISDWKQITN